MKNSGEFPDSGHVLPPPPPKNNWRLSVIQTKADKHQSPATSYNRRTQIHRLHPSFFSFLPPLLQPTQRPLPQHRTIYNPPHSPSSSHISSIISPTVHIRRPSATNSHRLHPFHRRPPFSASLRRSTSIFTTTTPPPLLSFPTPPNHHRIIFHHLSSLPLSLFSPAAPPFLPQRPPYSHYNLQSSLSCSFYSYYRR